MVMKIGVPQDLTSINKSQGEKKGKKGPIGGAFLIQRSPVLFRPRSHTQVMDYNEACFMHLTPGVVQNFPKTVGV